MQKYAIVCEFLHNLCISKYSKVFEILKMPLYAVKYAICTFLQSMRNMLRSHDRYKPVSLFVSQPTALKGEIAFICA